MTGSRASRRRRSVQCSTFAFLWLSRYAMAGVPRPNGCIDRSQFDRGPPMHPSLVSRSIIVTGASRGIGREIALALLEAGARVAIAASAETPHLAATLDAARAIAPAGHAVALVGDVRRPEDCARMTHDAVKAFGRIDVLFNNAAIPMPMSSGAGDKPLP